MCSVNTVKTLFELACETFTLSLNDASDIESLPLPRLLKQRTRAIVKDLWLNQGPLQPPGDFDYSNVDLLDMTRSELNMVMNYPVSELGIPDFVQHENCHIVWEYYRWTNEEPLPINFRDLAPAKAKEGISVTAAGQNTHWPCGRSKNESR